MALQRNIGLLAAQLALDSLTLQKAIYWALGELRIERVTPSPEQFREWRGTREGLMSFWSFANSRLASPITQEEAADAWRCVDLTLRTRQRRQMGFGEYLMVAARSKQICEKCGLAPPAVSLEIDHVLPVSRGGAETALNLRFLCGRCNRSRSNRFRWAEVWEKLPAGA